MRFAAEKVSDQKRLARGQQFLAARAALRARDETHHRAWRVLTLAGGAPSGEVAALRELMPKCHITAVDIDQRCLALAIDAGVNDVVLQDVTDWHERVSQTSWGGTTRALVAPAAISALAPFDLINMDLCAGANDTTKPIVARYKPLLTAGGVLILTFSYGRDVVEMFQSRLRALRYEGDTRIDRFVAAGVPEALLGRIAYMIAKSELPGVQSVIAYKGNEMPMCSVLLTRRVSHQLSYLQLEPGDLEIASAFPDAAKLYDCPQEQIESVRRRYAAFRATLTRQSNRRGLFAMPPTARKDG